MSDAARQACPHCIRSQRAKPVLVPANHICTACTFEGDAQGLQRCFESLQRAADFNHESLRDKFIAASLTGIRANPQFEGYTSEIAANWAIADADHVMHARLPKDPA